MPRQSSAYHFTRPPARPAFPQRSSCDQSASIARCPTTLPLSSPAKGLIDRLSALRSLRGRIENREATVPVSSRALRPKPIRPMRRSPSFRQSRKDFQPQLTRARSPVPAHPCQHHRGKKIPLRSDHHSRPIALPPSPAPLNSARHAGAFKIRSLFSLAVLGRSCERPRCTCAFTLRCNRSSSTSDKLGPSAPHCARRHRNLKPHQAYVNTIQHHLSSRSHSKTRPPSFSLPTSAIRPTICYAGSLLTLPATFLTSDSAPDGPPVRSCLAGAERNISRSTELSPGADQSSVLRLKRLFTDFVPALRLAPALPGSEKFPAPRHAADYLSIHSLSGKSASLSQRSRCPTFPRPTFSRPSPGAPRRSHHLTVQPARPRKSCRFSSIVKDLSRQRRRSPRSIYALHSEPAQSRGSWGGISPILTRIHTHRNAPRMPQPCAPD